ncbi:MAG: MFS transporter [Anaerolineae bacterium]
MLNPSHAFIRDKLTWLGYFMIAYLAYYQSALGPLMPFFQAENRYNYQQASLHFGAPAVGGMLVGLIGAWVVSRSGRKRAIWGGALGMFLGNLIFAYGQSLPITLSGVFLAGMSGVMLQNAVQSALSDRHGDQRAYALTELNTGASVAAMLAPLLIGTLERIGIGWRGAIFVPGMCMVMIAVFFGRVTIPNAPQADEPAPDTKPNGLPLTYWLYALALAFIGAIEWSVIFFGADFLEKSVGFSRVDAATLMTLFFLAMVIGRFVGSRLTRRYQSTGLLLGAIIITIVGFTLFWLSPVPWLSVLGLCINGLGSANLFPQGVSLALTAGAKRIDLANARLGLFISFAVLISPQILGNLADRVGIQGALGVVLGVQIAALFSIIVANYVRQQRIAYAA